MSATNFQVQLCNAFQHRNQIENANMRPKRDPKAHMARIHYARALPEINDLELQLCKHIWLVPNITESGGLPVHLSTRNCVLNAFY